MYRSYLAQLELLELKSLQQKFEEIHLLNHYNNSTEQRDSSPKRKSENTEENQVNLLTIYNEQCV